MKIAMAILVVAALALPCNGTEFAIDKGSWLLGGEIGFSSSGGDLYENADGDGETLIQFSPFVGYFVMPGLAVSSNVVFVSTSQGDDKNTAVGIGPMVEYYFGGPYSKWYPFASTRLVFISHSGETSVGGETVDVKHTEMSYGAAIGAAMMVSRNVAVRCALGYAVHSEDQEEPEDLDSVDGNRLGLSIGVQSFIW